MFSQMQFFPVVSSLLLGAVLALDDEKLDVTNQTSIKSVAKIIATDISNYHKASWTLQNGNQGLFDHGTNSSYSFWEAGAVWGSLLEFGFLTGDDLFKDHIGEYIYTQVGDGNFMPLNQTKDMGNNDQSSWALTAMTAAEIGLDMPKNSSGSWVGLAAEVFNNQVLRWGIGNSGDGACQGGLRWQIYSFNNGYNYADAYSNGNFFLLSARLAQFTGNKTYSDWAEKAYQWAQDSGLVKDYRVYAGVAAEGKCWSKSPNLLEWSMYHGLFLEAAATMLNVTNGADKWKTAVSGFLNSTNTFLNSTSYNLQETACEMKNDKCSKSIDELASEVTSMTVTELLDYITCYNVGKCNRDQQAFKGVTARSYARTIRSAPFTAEKLQKVLSASSTMAIENCIQVDNLLCAFKWGSVMPNDFLENIEWNLSELHNALAVTQGLLWPQAKALKTSSGGGGNGNLNSTTGDADAKKSGQPNSGGRIAASWGLVLVAGLALVVS